MLTTPLSIELLQEQHLLLSLYDYSSNESKYRIGQGVLSLKKTSLQSTIPFKVSLQISGVKTTDLEGVLHIQT